MTHTKEFKTITDLDQQILASLRETGDWQTRQQIAERMGRNHLTQYGATRLEIFTHRGLVETRRVPQKLGRPQYEYRAVIDDEKGLKG
jgi:predicted transcriptional regulator